MMVNISELEAMVAAARKTSAERRRQAELRGAFRALADVGCAVQLGLLAVFASRMLPAVYAPWDGPESPVRTHALAIGYSLLAGLGGRP